MIFFRKKSKQVSTNLQWDMEVDWHCHILPGVDDGVNTLEESLSILYELEMRGVREIWFTPHIMEDIPNETKSLKAIFKELKDNYQQKNLMSSVRNPINLHLSSENMLDELFVKRLAQNDLLPMINNHLLVETSFFAPPHNFMDILDEIRIKGYYPVLAHPERYAYMDEKDYLKLKEKCVKFQLNLMSLIGYYGSDVQKKAKKMLDKGFYEFTGSDIHRHSHLQIIDQMMTNNAVSKKSI